MLQSGRGGSSFRGSPPAECPRESSPSIGWPCTALRRHRLPQRGRCTCPRGREPKGQASMSLWDATYPGHPGPEQERHE
eukprot:8951526-Pyramimonas_sp.AAC.1